MLNGQDIICLSSIDWDFIWQSHQEIMAALAGQGNRVLFIENTGVRAPGFRDLPRLRRRVLNWLRGTKGFRQERENLFIYSPLLLPFPYARLARLINRTLLLRALRRWMEATRFRRPIFWTFLPTPLACELIRALELEMSVYYCSDDLASSSAAARRISQSERRLFEMADLVFVTSEKLRQRAVQSSRKVFLFPGGVDFEKFERARNSADDIPAELRGLRRPVVGYVGGVHRWIDQELLAAVADRMPETSFVLVGPPQTDLSRLARAGNVHLLGPKSHDEIPRYTKGFDVGIVPYRLSEYTAHVYPSKLNEYLAMGLPVIATELPEIQRFNAEHGAVVTIARNPGEFIEAIRSALAQTSPEVIERRIEAARRNGWVGRIAGMSALIEGELARRREGKERWQESLQQLYRNARRRVMLVVAWTTMAYLLLFYTPLIWLLAEPLRVSEPPQAADAIVVLAGGVGESGQAGQGYEERVTRAVELYRQGYARQLVFSSGFTYALHEPEIMRALAVSLGVPAERIVLEQQARNTFENVSYVTRVLSERGWRHILLVSSPYHMRRAQLVWRRVAPGTRVTCVPIRLSRFYAHGKDVWGMGTMRQATLQQIRGIAHEYLGLLAYWWRGYI